MKFINLTPHAITDVQSNKTFPPSGIVARVSASSVLRSVIDGVNIYQTSFGDTVDLPPFSNDDCDVLYIVSGMVLEANKDRGDLIAPGELVRDDKGNPIGCKGFRY